jgi:AcrR family transcriptional regulator
MDAGPPLQSIGDFAFVQRKSRMPDRWRRTPELPPRSQKAGRPTQEVAAQLSDHIIEAALTEFGERGVERTTMDMIASAARVSKRTLYGRFGSKRDLILSAIELAFRDYIDPVVEEPLPDGPVRMRLRAAGEKLLQASMRPEISMLADLISWAYDNVPELAVATLALMDRGPTRLFRGLLELAAERGEIVVDDLDFTASFVADALIRTPRVRFVMNRDAIDDGELRRRYIEQALDLLLQGLAPRPAT